MRTPTSIGGAARLWRTDGGLRRALPLALNCAVTLIDHSGNRVRIETSQGTLTANQVIVTVPTNLIADEAIRFHPALPEKVDAARASRLASPTR